jgi:hypothetical protein
MTKAGLRPRPAAFSGFRDCSTPPQAVTSRGYCSARRGEVCARLLRERLSSSRAAPVFKTVVRWDAVGLARTGQGRAVRARIFGCARRGIRFPTRASVCPWAER